ncbi:MAG: DUF4231 domain-containing protein [Phascolarctobacterium sp.]|nr:DUF4231 domain-containing protein [Phascolarctobacterium sp.]
MDSKEYLDKVVDDQINWYSAKSADAQKRHKRYKKIEVFLTLLLTFVSTFLDYVIPVCLCGANFNLHLGPVVTFIGLIVSYVQFLHGFGKYQENWVNYRRTCEALKREKNLYLTSSGVYHNNETGFEMFVERCEQIRATENSDWGEVHKKHKAINI